MWRFLRCRYKGSNSANSASLVGSGIVIVASEWPRYRYGCLKDGSDSSLDFLPTVSIGSVLTRSRAYAAAEDALRSPPKRKIPKLFDTAAALLDWLGLIVFAILRALVASSKQMDVVGFVLLGAVTGIDGGTLRDLLLGLSPVFWVREPAVLLACVIVSCAVFFTAHIPQSRYRLLLWLDAGLALFAVTGAERALLAGSGAVVAVAMECFPVKSMSRQPLLGRSSLLCSRVSA
ncbi:trimeric intracellular cation channel family protein [Mesorhizobium sp. L48C026A00]|uniref:trimeric intracellular cation channel family protein n=1 Tax=Mesorhizobium sp. L48C026A00 TaxID=1287182 RepID=UPI0027BA0D0C|nr:TRIC cation channel family protein [Mesorhizobium sp. L48C026A00]